MLMQYVFNVHRLQSICFLLMTCEWYALAWHFSVVEIIMENIMNHSITYAPIGRHVAQ